MQIKNIGNQLLLVVFFNIFEFTMKFIYFV